MLVVIARLTGVLQSVELVAFDYLLRSRPPESTDKRILIVEINEDDIKAIGKYPIPDERLAALITTLQSSSPSVIGFDFFRDLPVGSSSTLSEQFASSANIIGIERVALTGSDDAIAPPPAFPPERVGFVNAVLDTDGYLRRSLLGASDLEENYRLSFTIRLTESYLSTYGLALGNGIRDSQAMRFGETEIPNFYPNTGAYVGADDGGEQTLLNVRSGAKPFQIVSFTDVETGQVPDGWIRDRIVLIGPTAMSAADFVGSAATRSRNPALNPGVEMQAHAISQLINAALEDRPLIRSWGDGWEYVWIIGWGIAGLKVGIALSSGLTALISAVLEAMICVTCGNRSQQQSWGTRWKYMWMIGWSISGLKFGIEFSSSLRILVGILLSLGILVGVCYSALILGWWIPLVPSLLVLTLNGAILAVSRFYQYELRLKTQLQERQLILEHIFDTLHNGPLQSIAGMLRQARERSDEVFLGDLEALNQELRAVYESIRYEVLSQDSRFYVNSQLSVDLNQPLHEVLYEIYDHTLTRELPYFRAIKLKVITFEEINSQSLSREQKRSICRFLEEALCNVGKHAKGTTRLMVICKSEGQWNYIAIQDNGCSVQGSTDISDGRGTQQAKNLARQLGGKFRRYAPDSGGTICELRWPIDERSLFRFLRLLN